MTSHSDRPIVLIHGLWMTPSSWDPWAQLYRELGHEVIVPGWPGVGASTPADIRDDPSGLRGVGIADLVAHYAGIIASLPTKPIVMGHSFGGLVALVLADRNLAAATVAVEPGPPAGVLTVPPAMLRTGLPILSNPFARNGATPMSKGHFHFTFGNDLSRADSDREWEAQAIPAANRVMWDGVLNLPRGRSASSWVDFGKDDHEPLLILAGTADHTVPVQTVLATYKKFQRAQSESIVEYREYEGKTHRIISQTGWQSVARDSLSWAVQNAR